MKYYNENLITLKCVLFLFFGALGSLLPFLPLHMTNIGLFKDESIIISVIAPLIALIGPLVAAPLADRLAGGFGGAKRSKTGAYLRVMISVCFLLATIFYWLLMAIPRLERSPPEVSFYCDENRGFVLQKRCGAEKTCYNWGSNKGSILVKNCKFSCNASVSYTGDDMQRTTLPPPDLDEHYSGEDIPQYAEESNDIVTELDPGFVPYPHMCFWNSSDDQVCAVYTEHSQLISFHVGLNQHASDVDNETDSDTCTYPVADRFHCRTHLAEVLKILKNDPSEECSPVIQCAIHDPYNNTDSLLKRSQCGYDNVGFWLYLFIRSFADMFTVTAVVLLATAVVIATRETSTGRGDIGKQYAAGALGFGIFAPIIGGVQGNFLYGMISFSVLMILATIIILVDRKMPLSPPEWWWHTRCGLLALPMSSVRKYGLETAALVFVLLLLGIFWNAIDSFLPWHAVWLAGDLNQTVIIGLTITIAAIPAVIFLIFAEKIVDYCGHSNLLILCFVNYICHHLGLMFIEDAALLLICEFLELFTLHAMYITAVLYLRHLIPRKLTACGQALPIIAHFCIGRCIGALLGGIAYSGHPANFQSVHKWFSISAAIFAVIYFICYHLYLKPKCAAPLHVPPDPAPAVVQSMNGNGAYTPLRVYHNSKSKKGHFRY